MKKKLVTIAVAFACFLGFTPLQAHHSIVEFDYSKGYAVTGTVKELQWTNPHSWVQVMVPNESGGFDEWGFELGAPLFNIRMGWKKDSILPGEEVTVVFSPAKNGRPRGTLMRIHLPNGETLNGIAPNFYTGPAYDDLNAVPAPPPLP